MTTLNENMTEIARLKAERAGAEPLTHYAIGVRASAITHEEAATYLDDGSFEVDESSYREIADNVQIVLDKCEGGFKVVPDTIQLWDWLDTEGIFSLRVKGYGSFPEAEFTDEADEAGFRYMWIKQHV